MHFSSAVTTRPHLQDALTEVIEQIEARHQDHPLDFVQIFITPHFRMAANDIVKQLQGTLKPQVLLGCTAESVIGSGRELEGTAAMALVAAHLPQVRLTPFKLQTAKWDALLEPAEAFHQVIGAPEDVKLFVLLGDPFTTPMDRVLGAFNSHYPGVPMVGGLASGSYRAGGNALVFNESVLNNGAIGVAFAGAFDVDVVVSQGCRPIGQPFTVTSVQDNVILSLEGQPPLKLLQDLINELSEADQGLLQNGLFIGRAINDNQAELGRGDFLIRGISGIDRENGALIVSDYLQSGETVQFHLRDANTAEEDLEMMLTPQLLYDPPAGAMLFSCNGRGTRLYPHPDGDISTIRKVVGDVDLAGFFCAGEIGPIGGRNFLHGHTASLALFRPLTDS